MTTKWLNKLDEQKLVGTELFDGNKIVWTRKTEKNGETSLDLIYLDEGSSYELFNRFVNFFKAKCETEIGKNVEKFLTENEYEIDEYMNFFEYDPSHPAQSFLSFAKENGININYVKVDGDFGHVAQLVGTENTSIEEFNPAFENAFVSILTKFFFQPYFCEAGIAKMEARKQRLEEISKNQTIIERINFKTDEKIVHCLNSIEAFTNELNYYNQKYAEREMNSTNELLNRIEKKYNLDQGK